MTATSAARSGAVPRPLTSGPVAPSGTALTGTAALTRFAVRRDRVRIVVWIASIVLLVVSTVASIQGLYPTHADLVQAAAVSRNNAAAIIFNGPAQGLDTVGGQVAFQTGTFGLIVMGLMSLFMLGRLTRGEEEAGRTDLLRSLPIGDRALPAAALITVAGMAVTTGALVALTLVALGLPTTGSVVFGLSFALFGLFMAALTLAVAQVTENTRVVYGIGGIVLGVAFVVRAVGDIGDGSISWLSPIGWAQKTRPFAGDQWWPFLVLVAATAGLAWGAAALARRRDVGAGLVAPRAGRPRAEPSLGTPLGLATRLQRGSVVGWTAGLVALAGAYGSVADSIDQFVKDNRALTDIIAAQGNGTLVEQYVAMSFRILALVAAAFAIQSALRVRSEEMSGRTEQVLATPVSRLRFAGSHLVLAFGGAVVVLGLSGVAFGLVDAAVTGDGGVVGTAVLAALVFTPAVWVLVGVTVLAIGVVPRLATALPWALLAVCFTIGMFGRLLDLPQWASDVSPFQHVPPYPAADLGPAPLVALVLAAAVLTGAGLAALRHRDLT
jgi:ABC-2 type transport system permease protein